MSDLAVRVEGLGKMFPQVGGSLANEYSRVLAGLREYLAAARKGALVPSREQFRDRRKGFWVFRGIIFDIRPGEVFGIIGRNGCGKTTLLRILSRVLDPTEGRAEIRGRVNSLLAVGTGFHPAFTGRENVYLNGALLGLGRKEIDRKFDQIVEFSEIADFIDAPVKTYSSGMNARLAFAVAAQLDPEILILDEVLSVGDAAFRSKCVDTMNRLKAQGRTILLVSHNMGAIQSYCDRCMLIQAGGLGAIGEPSDVIQTYLSSFQTVEEDIPLKERQDREGSGILRVVNYFFETTSGHAMASPESGQSCYLCFEYESHAEAPLDNVHIGVAIGDESGRWLFRVSTEVTNSPFSGITGTGVFKCYFDRWPLVRGTFTTWFRVADGRGIAADPPYGGSCDASGGDFVGTGKADTNSQVYLSHAWLNESRTPSPSAA